MPITILIADDSRTMRELFRQKLTAEHFRVLAAASGQEAVKILSGETPDLIMLDLTMPDMSGCDILQAVRRQDRLKRVPVLVLTGNSNPEELQRARVLGATDCILKSTTPPDNVIRQIGVALDEARRSRMAA